MTGFSVAAEPDFRLPDADFTRFCRFFYDRTGISFAPSKRYFVDKRVAACIEAAGSRDFASWFADLAAAHNSRRVEELVNRLTVNETYFFRESHQFDALVRTVLPELARRSGKRPLRLLCMPCSTGEEVYSVAFSLVRDWPGIADHDVQIIGTDIDTDVLQAARSATYGSRSLHRVDATTRSRFFTPLGNDRWQVDADIRAAVDFRHVNVTDAAAMRALGTFDVVFCRNLLIYFDAVSSRVATQNLYTALRPGGYLFLGHSESMSRISTIFDPVRLPEGIIYQRAEARP